MSKSSGPFASFVDSIPHPVLVTDAQGIIQSASDAFLRMYGLKREDTLGKTIPLRNLQRPLKDVIKRGRAGRQAVDLGKERWLVTLTPHNVHGRLHQVILSWNESSEKMEHQKDVTQRQRAMQSLDLRALQATDESFLKTLELENLREELSRIQQRLIESEAQFRAVGDSLSLGVWSCTPDGQFDYASDSFLEFLGVPLSELSAQMIFDRSVNTATPRLLTEWQQCFAAGRPWNQELLLKGASGEIRTVLSYARPVFNTEGKITRWSGVNLDLTDKKVTENQLKDSYILFHQLNEKLSDQGVWMTSVHKGEMAYVSPGVANIWGVTVDDLLLDPGSLIEAVHPDDRALVVSAMSEQNAGQVQSLQYRIVRPDGEIRWVSVKGFPVRNSEGRIYRVANIATDITEFKKVQARLKRATRSAVLANRVKTQFLANMSHEIRTPLGAILGFTELISRAQIPNDIRDWVSIIQRNGSHLLGLIDEILDISQIEAHRFEIDRGITDPVLEAKEAILLLNNRAAQKNLQLIFKTEGKMPASITCDAKRLRQILINLVGNAIKFTDSGSVTLTLKNEKWNGQDSLDFLVEDTGRGIPPKQLNSLFQPFVQGDSSIKRIYGGTGLGLAISIAYAQALGGTVELVNSIEGRGSVFALRLPLVSAEQAETCALKVSSVTPEPTRNILDDIRVLVIDDAPDNRELISLFLRKSGATVECADNGLEGIRMATHDNFDVILMDIQMPGLDGMAATKRLREAKYERPILALTAHAMKSDRDRYLNSGFNDHLSKPINPKALVDAIVKFSGLTIH